MITVLTAIAKHSLMKHVNATLCCTEYFCAIILCLLLHTQRTGGSAFGFSKANRANSDANAFSNNNTRNINNNCTDAAATADAVAPASGYNGPAATTATSEDVTGRRGTIRMSVSDTPQNEESAV
jgi:hypothetical protein